MYDIKGNMYALESQTAYTNVKENKYEDSASDREDIMDIRIDAVFSLANDDEDLSETGNKKVVSANQGSSRKAAPPTNDDMDAPPSLTLVEDVLPSAIAVEDNVDTMTPPTLTPVPGLPLPDDTHSLSFDSTVARVPSVITKRKRIFPSYVCLTKIDRLLTGGKNISYRKFRRMKFKECFNMCKKMHFIRQLKNGQNVFNVKIVKDSPGNNEQEPQGKLSAGSKENVKCKRVHRRQVDKYIVNVTTSEKKAGQLHEMRVVVEQQRLRKRVSYLAKPNNGRTGLACSPISSKVEMRSSTSEKEKIKSQGTPSQKRHTKVVRKSPKAKDADQSKDKRSPHKVKKKLESTTEAPSVVKPEEAVVTIVGRSGRVVKPNSMLSGYITTLSGMQEEQKLKKLADAAEKKRKEDRWKWPFETPKKEEFQFELDNPEVNSAENAVSRKFMPNTVKESKSYDSKTISKPKGAKRRKQLASPKKHTVEILRDSTADDDSDIINTLLSDYAFPSPSPGETAASVNQKTPVDDESLYVSQQFPYARSLLANSKPGSSTSAAKQKNSVPATRPPLSVTTSHALPTSPLLVTCKPTTPRQTGTHPALIQHNGQLFLTYTNAPSSNVGASTTIANVNNAKPVSLISGSSSSVTGVPPIRPSSNGKAHPNSNVKTVLPKHMLQHGSKSTTSGFYVPSLLPNSPTQPVTARYQLQPIIPSSVLQKPPHIFPVGTIDKGSSTTTTTTTRTSTTTTSSSLAKVIANNGTTLEPPSIQYSLSVAQPLSTSYHNTTSLLKSSVRAPPSSTSVFSSPITDGVNSTKTPLLTKIKQEPKSPGEEPETTNVKKGDAQSNQTQTKLLLVRVDGKNILIPVKNNVLQSKAFVVSEKNGKVSGLVTETTTTAATSGPSSVCPPEIKAKFSILPDRKKGQTAKSTSCTATASTPSIPATKQVPLSPTPIEIGKKRQLEASSANSDSESPGKSNPEKIEGSDPPAKKAAFSEGVTQREEKLRRLKALLKEKQKAVEDLRQSKIKSIESAKEGV